MHGLLENAEFRYVGAAVSASNSIDNNSSRIDMADYESVVFVTTIVDSVATGVATMAIQEADEDADTNMADVTDTLATATSATNDDLNNKLFVSEVFKPSKRYVQANRRSATANIAYGECIAILIPKRQPATQGATVQDTARAAN